MNMHPMGKDIEEKNEHKSMNNFLSISYNKCFCCSKELSHRNGSFEYTQHMFLSKNKKVNF